MKKFFSAGFAGVAFPVGLAVVFLAFHLPYLPASLEDLDSINFALGIRQFDVAHHQPHPPGYPVFILIGKALHAVGPSEAHALALLSVAAGALGVLGVAALFRRLDCPDTPLRWSVAAVGLAMTTPLYWFTAVRPLSDSSGLAAALAVQAMTLAATSARGLAIAGFCAGLAAGLRSQVVWLTVPLMIVHGLNYGGHRGRQGSVLAEKDLFSVSPVSSLVAAFSAFLAGALLWLVPLVIVSGGPSAYWHALFDQGAEDLGNIQMLWTMHRARDVTDALYYAFAAPWAAWPVAAVALTSLVFGLVRLARHQPHVVIVLALAFGPYLVFDLLFQETFTSRYALPLVVPMAYLAVAGLRLLPWDTGLALAVAIAMFCAHAGGTSIAAYSRAKAPAFRLLDDMRSAARSTSQPPVLAMDRREALDLRRPMQWAGDAMPAVAQILPSPPQHEWLEAVKYWNGGGRAPVWFVVDPMRTTIDLVQHGGPSEYRWKLPYPVLLSGVRPNEMDWYRVDQPEWYVGEGWALTPEAAGVADADLRGPSLAPIDGWVRRDLLSGVLMIGGRSLDPTERPRLIVGVDGRAVSDGALAPGPFLRFIRLSDHLGDGKDQRPYAGITVQATAGSRVAIEQVDASVTRPMLGFGDGWHEYEFNPRSGARWRWSSARAELVVSVPWQYRFMSRMPRMTLHIEGESPLKYFSRGSLLTVRVSPQAKFDFPLSSDFSVNVPIDDMSPTLDESSETSSVYHVVLETDQTFAPAERSGRTKDRRRLGLRIFESEITTDSTAEPPQRTPRIPR